MRHSAANQVVRTLLTKLNQTFHIASLTFVNLSMEKLKIKITMGVLLG